MTLTLHDLLFLVGSGIALTGCWMTSTAAGLIGTGLATCAAARVLHFITAQRRGRR
jgi:hypothetical protein